MFDNRHIDSTKAQSEGRQSRSGPEAVHVASHLTLGVAGANCCTSTFA